MKSSMRLVIVVGLLVAAPGGAVAQSAPLWGGLTPGPHGVGYRSAWELDYSRRYNTAFADGSRYAEGKAPRPILVNVWYPAARTDGKRMSHRDYLAISSTDAKLAKFAAELAEYNRNTIAREMLGKPLKELTGRDKEVLQEFLDTPTACVRGATPAKGSFPLVIYHSGAGSSFEDNAVYCELLASHGFVVAGSAFQRDDGNSLGTGSVEGSARDIEFLIAQARCWPGVDWNHIGLVGHSLGAQAALYYRSQTGAAVDAVVSLDTTQDYRGVSDPTWEYLTTPVMKNAKRFDCPLLMVADPHAFFELADALPRAERYYLTLKGMSHNDYITQGTLGRDLRLRVGDAKKSAEALAKEKAELATARAGYRAVCEYALQFLNANLKADAAAREFLKTQYRATSLGGEKPHVEFTPVGQTGPEPFKEGSTVPPTPRQAYRLLRETGSAKAVAVLGRHRKEAASAPIYEQGFELYLVSDIIDRHHLDDARTFAAYCRENGNDCLKKFLSFGQTFEKIGRTDWAVRFYRRAAQLDPSSKEAVAKLREIEGKKSQGK